MKRIRRFAIAAVLLLPLADGAVAHAQGKFVGTVRAEWIGERNMKLLAPFEFIDGSGRSWPVPTGSIVNGASIPRPFWSVIGGPFEGPYRNASVVHDYHCDAKKASWQDVHRMFFHAMIAEGTAIAKAKIMYYAVLVGGPRWKAVRVTNHEPRAFSRPGDIDRNEVRPWTIAYDEPLAREHMRRIESEELTLQQIEELANGAFRGVEPPAVVRIP